MHKSNGTTTIALATPDAKMIAYYLRIAAATFKAEAEAGGIGPVVYQRRMERWRHADQVATAIAAQVGYPNT